MKFSHSHSGFISLEAALGFLVLLPAAYLGLGLADYMLTSREVEQIALSGAHDNTLKPFYTATGDQGFYARSSMSRDTTIDQEFTAFAQGLMDELLPLLRRLDICPPNGTPPLFDCDESRFFLEVRFTALNIDGNRGLPCGTTTCERDEFKRPLTNDGQQWSRPANHPEFSGQTPMKSNEYFRAFGLLPGTHLELITPIQEMYSKLLNEGRTEFYNAIPTANYQAGQRQYYGVSNENMFRHGGTVEESVFQNNFLLQTPLIGILLKVDIGRTFGGRVMNLLTTSGIGEPPDSLILTYRRFIAPRKQL